MGIFIDRLGHKFGRLTVIERLPNIKDGRATRVVWRCVCDCGKVVDCVSTSLVSGNVRSCGCLFRDVMCGVNAKKRRDITGRVFGRLQAVAPTEKRNGANVVWECLCSCGNTTFVPTCNLTNGGTVSCGCKKSDKVYDAAISCGHLPKWRDGQLLTGAKFASYMYGAKARGIEFAITIDEVWEVFISQGGVCALTGLPISLYPGTKNKHLSNASMDRIDSTKGYIAGNIQWVHKWVNAMKSDFSDETFVQICKFVAEEADRKAA